MLTTSSPEYKYQMFKVALETFKKPVNELDNQEREETNRIASRMMSIQSTVLSSSESSKVCITEDHKSEVLEEIKQSFEDEDAFVSSLEAVNLELEDFVQAITRELLVEAVLEYISAEVPEIDETEASLFYYMNLNQFQRPEIRVAKHILITINDENPENTRDRSLQKISSIRDRVATKPARFEEQALKHSECPTSLEGGLLGNVKKGTLYKSLEAVLFTMQEGEISEVVESELGFHILKCERVDAEHLATIQEVLPQLKEQLNQRKKSQAQRQWLQAQLQNKSQEAAQTSSMETKL